MVIHYKDSKGRARIKGGAHLKASQAYPDKPLVVILFMSKPHDVSCRPGSVWPLQRSAPSTAGGTGLRQ